VGGVYEEPRDCFRTIKGIIGYLKKRRCNLHLLTLAGLSGRGRSPWEKALPVLRGTTRVEKANHPSRYQLLAQHGLNATPLAIRRWN